jgi:hypothetical protein
MNKLLKNILSENIESLSNEKLYEIESKTLLRIKSDNFLSLLANLKNKIIHNLVFLNLLYLINYEFHVFYLLVLLY